MDHEASEAMREIVNSPVITFFLFVMSTNTACGSLYTLYVQPQNHGFLWASTLVNLSLSLLTWLRWRRMTGHF